MKDSFKVKVNGDFEYSLSAADLNMLDCIETAAASYHVLVNNQPYSAKVLQSDFNRKHYEIQINSNRYMVEISDRLDLLIDEMGFSLVSSMNISSIEAPMPGLILDINVSVGQEVNEDEALLVLEAMKMENIITAPRGGVIKAIHISKGNPVDKGQLLIEFE
ncbi:MAG: acetyl-CoA carboxylase biotin carboxyl carrier protein subunit [Eudoraea sp.]|nr:acetyl-CoA carboxylase biotin carboxyl carrier protein subunit [Eudoraea sp.]MBT8209995.1 acetyl-CoA carboxylase biotin carboxyl carrier protein subunit [Eudoraea sp.]MBT8222609.1 acetyl-CoA carboxylase biotin carboxyl carrier protein subunit [Eudoraea sp.]NNK30916.1 acetyl-CoA carboxylase biotin carboxyl carrier protein subunit [Flavobacteriaceae bacterium]